MNSFRPLVYLSKGANATRVFCRDSGLVQGDFAPAIAWTDCGPSPKRQIQSTRRRYIANSAHWPNFRLGDHSGAIRKAWLLWAGLIRTRELSSYRFYVCTPGPKMLALDGLMRISSVSSG